MPNFLCKISCKRFMHQFFFTTKKINIHSELLVDSPFSTNSIFLNSGSHKNDQAFKLKLKSWLPSRIIHWWCIDQPLENPPGCHPEVLLNKIADDSQWEQSDEEDRGDVRYDAHRWHTQKSWAAQTIHGTRDVLGLIQFSLVV